MKPLNKYEMTEQGEQKILQIKLMDVLYNDNVKTLVYLRNITNLVQYSNN